MQDMDAGGCIGGMPLQVGAPRVYRELAELGVTREQRLTPELLFPFDQFHYHGIDAVRAAAGLIGLGRESRVLEIGSGLGGPARYLAHTVGCHVMALELDQDVHDIASDLTRRCGLHSLVSHVQGDALSHPLEVGGFDTAVSWMALHQIPERPRLLERLAQAVRPGGHIYLEDFVLRELSSREDLLAMRHVLHALTLTDAEDLAQEIEDAGFEEIDMTDMTPSWGSFSRARAKTFSENRERHVRVHGDEIAARLEQYFSAVERQFTSGSLGGVRICARRP